MRLFDNVLLAIIDVYLGNVTLRKYLLLWQKPKLLLVSLYHRPLLCHCWEVGMEKSGCRKGLYFEEWLQMNS